MVDEVPDEFASLGVVLVLVADLLTGHLRRYGDPVAARWLVMQLFGTPSKTRDTAATCQDQIMPRIWQQGQDHCFLIIPSNDILVGLVVPERQNRTQRRINEANADWKNGHELNRFKYKLLPEDGLTAEEVSWL